MSGDSCLLRAKDEAPKGWEEVLGEAWGLLGIGAPWCGDSMELFSWGTPTLHLEVFPLELASLLTGVSCWGQRHGWEVEREAGWSAP